MIEMAPHDALSLGAKTESPSGRSGLSSPPICDLIEEVCGPQWPAIAP